MRRLVAVLAAVALLAVGTATMAFAQTPPAGQGQYGWGCPGWGAGAWGSNDAATNPTLKRLAEKLGLGSAADLAKELQAGKSVLDVAKARNVAEQGLIDALLAPQADMLKVRMSYGYVTKEQADTMLKFMAERARVQLSQPGFLGGPGGGMMGPGMMGRGMMGPGMMGRGPQGTGPGFRGSSY